MASRESAKARHQKHRAIIQAYKKGKGCCDCGYNEHDEALDFDHVGDDKQFNIAHHANYSLERIFAEIAKCEVVCANCHRVRTARRRNGVAS